ncbi:hypothetical protein BJV74DRAFT_858160, partial [Russula compacta]
MTNFVHSLPFSCISLGLLDQRTPVLGTIYNPFLEQLYTGVHGAGSFLQTCMPTITSHNTAPTATAATSDPQPLLLAPPQPLPSLTGALIVVEWGSDCTWEAMCIKGPLHHFSLGNDSVPLGVPVAGVIPTPVGVTPGSNPHPQASVGFSRVWVWVSLWMPRGTPMSFPTLCTHS